MRETCEHPHDSRRYFTLGEWWCRECGALHTESLTLIPRGCPDAHGGQPTATPNGSLMRGAMEGGQRTAVDALTPEEREAVEWARDRDEVCSDTLDLMKAALDRVAPKPEEPDPHGGVRS